MEQFSDLERDYFDAYAYDTIWSLAYMYQSDVFNDPANKQLFRIGIENIDFIGATVSVDWKKRSISKRDDCREESGI